MWIIKELEAWLGVEVDNVLELTGHTDYNIVSSVSKPGLQIITRMNVNDKKYSNFKRLGHTHLHRGGIGYRM